MKLIKKSSAKEVKNSKSCIAIEYPLDDSDLNGAVIVLDGRYPDKGYALNLKCKELAYIISGKGKFFQPGKETEVSEGDMVLIEKNEKYYWEGNLKMFIQCNPSWYPEQHKEVS